MDIRIQIQTKLGQIQDLSAGVPIPDGMVQDGQTYLGYEISEDYLNSDFNKNNTMRINFTGRLVRKEDPSENTLEIIDNAIENIKTKLKELNFKVSWNDISFQDGIRKVLIKANARYNEINDELIV